LAIVTQDAPGRQGPNVVNGDGNHTGFSVADTGTDQVRADGNRPDSTLAGVRSSLTGDAPTTTPGELAARVEPTEDDPPTGRLDIDHSPRSWRLSFGTKPDARNQTEVEPLS